MTDLTSSSEVHASPFGIRAKLLGFTVVLIVSVALVLTSYSAMSNREHLLEVYQENAIEVGDTLAEAVINDLYQLDLRGLRLRLRAVHTNSAITATYILDEQGQVLSDGTSANSLRGERLDDPFVDRLLTSQAWVIEHSQHLLKLGRSIRMEGSEKPLGHLYLQLSLQDLHDKIFHQFQETILILMVCLLLALMVAWWFSARFTRPITALTQAANRIHEGDGLTQVEIPITGRDEIRTLSLSLEGMLQRLQKSDRTLRELNLSLDQKVRERTQELQETLQIIHSSIHYASRIQRSILPDPGFMQFLFPSHFVVWQPRDVVGGDMYWCRLWGMGTLLVVGDCTGHGVPGAFMTLIANGALGHAINMTPSGALSTLISAMHGNIQGILGREQEMGDADDGLELGACYFPPDKKELLFVGARFSLFYQDPGQPVVEVKGDRSGIGYRTITERPTFTQHLLELLPNRRFTLTTDGILDQVGGERRMGFSRSRFKQLLEEHETTPVQAVGACLYEQLVAYQGDERRRDDVTIVGFAVPTQGDQDECP